ncbi:MAG: cytochrome b, partial [Gordonia polyisoprenivorans]|nr:cytochrome b [Gordonia polyisoprenivorans]
YEGSYAQLRGIEMSEAYASALHLSFDVRGGLLMRQIHHWAAMLFIASMMIHMMRVFFTGAHRKPRELNWVIGCLLLILGTLEGFTGYSLPDDLLSGTGVRAADGFMKASPVIGSYMSFFIFGGEFPGTSVIPRLYSVHILLIPGLLLGLIAAHMLLLVYHKHTQWPGPGRTEENVVGFPMLPVYAAKAGGFFFIVFGVIMLVAATVTINPIWNYGPYDPSPVSAGTQPDWYIGFADGALRLIPPHWEFMIGPYTVSMNIIVPVLALLVLLAAVAAYPFLEAWVTGDRREHHIADRPRNAPTRTAIGAAGVTFYAGLWAAASSDLMATHFRLSIEVVTHAIQAVTVLGPFVAYFVTKRICLALQKKDREIALHGFESGRIVRLPGGEYVEVHQPLSDYERWRLVSYEDYQPIMLRPDRRGRITAGMRMRARMSSMFFEDRIAPVTQTELDAAHHHGHAAVESAEETPELETAGRH